MKQKRPYFRILLAALGIAASLYFVVASQIEKNSAKRGFTFLKETTYFTEPITADGYVDYLAAINTKLKVGVTPENNALVAIMQSLGPKPEGGRMHDDFYQLLGAPEPREGGEYLIDLTTYAKQQQQLVKAPADEYVWMTDTTARLTKRSWTKKEFPEWALWVQQNSKPLSLVAEANKRSRYYLPYLVKTAVPSKSAVQQVGGILGMMLPTIQPTRELANALLARAMLHTGEKEYQAAWQDIHSAMKLGRLVGQGLTIIELLLAYAIEGSACETALALLEQEDCPKTILQQMLKDMQNFPPLPSLAGRLDQGERCMALDTLLMVHRYGQEYLKRVSGERTTDPLILTSELHHADWDVPLKEINSYFDRLVVILSEKDRSQREVLLRDFIIELEEGKIKVYEDETSFLGFLHSSNIRVKRLGEKFKVALFPAIRKTYAAGEKVTQQQYNLQVAIALSWFMRDNGGYPASLDELSPNYLKVIPNDYLNDKQLVYEKTEKGFRFHSVGMNGLDDMGVTQQENPRCDDITVTMPLPPLRKSNE